MAWTQSPCPKCGRFERHDDRMHLKLCAICLMREADAIDLKSKTEFAWKKTLLNIMKKYHLSQRDLAFVLKVSPQLITEVKNGRSSFSSEVIANIKEKYSECLTQNT